MPQTTRFFLVWLALLALFAATGEKKHHLWAPPDVPEELKAIVPQPYHKWVFAVGWMDSAVRRVVPGGKTDNDLYRFQCGVLEHTLVELGRRVRAAEFPLTLEEARRWTLWRLDRLSWNALSPEQIGYLGPDPSSQKYPSILDHQWFYQEATTSGGDERYRPGGVIIVRIPFRGPREQPFEAGVTVICAGGLAEKRFPDKPGKAYGPEVELGYSHIYWRKGAEPVTGNWSWAAFGASIRDALTGFVVRFGRVPESHAELERAMGKRNPKLWTREMERVVDEYLIPRFKAALEASSGAK